MTSPRIGVVIVAYNASPQAAVLAQSLAGQGVDPHDVVIVNNGEQPDRQATAEKLWSEGTWLHLPNPGYGGAVNAAVATLPEGVDVVAMLADDVTLSPGLLPALAAELDDPQVALVGPALFDSRDGSLWSHGGTMADRGNNPHHLRPERDYPGPPLWLDAAVAVMRRTDFRALGGFDEAWFHYYQDVDFGLRVIRDLHKRIVVRTDLSATKVPNEDLTPYIDTSGRLRLQRKHQQWTAVLLLLADTFVRTVVGCLKSPGQAKEKLRERATAVRDGLFR
ncbi:glycosyltransferase family 2 protein [Spongisporangium articulatum]|uniref:Glycosyltransferase family 2 protein n=1 Tax=Spongisporangium articulatum TaxID=3362603 RepID=A0ABW8AKC3_9ACTN